MNAVTVATAPSLAGPLTYYALFLKGTALLLL